MKINLLVCKNAKKLLIFFISLITILITLYGGNDVFLSDNGDYTRVLRLASMYKTETGDIKIIVDNSSLLSSVLNIIFDTKNITTYLSSQIIFVRCAVVVNIIFNKLLNAEINSFNIFYFGIMCSIAYACVISFLLCQFKIENIRLDCIFSFIVIIIMCDIAYVGYFNSLYGEGIQHILFVLLIALLLRLRTNGVKIKDIIFFYVVLTLYGTSKPFNIPNAMLIGLIYAAIVYVIRREFRESVLTYISFGITLVMLCTTFSVIPRWIKRETNYNSVFFGILKHCDENEARKYLESINLDEELCSLNDTNSYVSNIEEIRSSYNLSGIEELSYLDLVKFYITHPKKTLNTLLRVVKFCGTLRNQFFMDCNFMKDIHRMHWWSHIRENSGFDTIYLNLLIILIFLFLYVQNIRKFIFNRFIGLFVLGIIVTNIIYVFVSPYIANGEGDLSKHMFMYMENIDVMLIFIIYKILSGNRIQKSVSSSVIYTMIISLILSGTYSSPQMISFGRYEGKELKWIIVDETKEYRTLLCSLPVDYDVYSNTADNFYEKSKIRKWLNTDFLSEFSKNEKDRIYKVKHKVLYSKKYTDIADVGTRDFYCCLYPEFAFEGYDRAYGGYITDMVFLPNVKHIKMLEKHNYKISCGQKYWLETCYFNNGEKVRYVNEDGLIYFDFANVNMGIRPVIHVKK